MNPHHFNCSLSQKLPSNYLYFFYLNVQNVKKKSPSSCALASIGCNNINQCLLTSIVYRNNLFLFLFICLFSSLFLNGLRIAQIFSKIIWFLSISTFSSPKILLYTYIFIYIYIYNYLRSNSCNHMLCYCVHSFHIHYFCLICELVCFLLCFFLFTKES